MPNYETGRQFEIDSSAISNQTAKVAQALADTEATVLDSCCGIDQLAAKAFDELFPLFQEKQRKVESLKEKAKEETEKETDKETDKKIKEINNEYAKQRKPILRFLTPANQSGKDAGALAGIDATVLDSCGADEGRVPRLFDKTYSVMSSNSQLCTKKDFDNFLDSPYVEFVCKVIYEAGRRMEQGLITDKDFEDFKKDLKVGELPAFVFNGHSTTGKRKTSVMQPSGLGMLDTDHMIGDPKAVYEDKIKGHEKELGIAAAHISPSGGGIHLIYKLKKSETVAQANERIFTQLQLDKDGRLPEGYDKVVHDVTRCSFAVPRKYFLYIDNALLFTRADEPQTNMGGSVQTITQVQTVTKAQTATTAKNCSSTTVAQPKNGAEDMDSATTATVSTQDQMTGEQALEMFDRVCSEVLSLNPMSIDTVGQRHNNLMNLLASGICKVVPMELMRQAVAKRMASYAGEADCQSLINDYYVKYLDANSPLSRKLFTIRAQVLGLSSQAKAGSTTDDDDEWDTWEREQQELGRKIAKLLPPGLSDTLVGLPDNMKMPVLCTVLPAAAAYASGVEAVYVDGYPHILGLMSVIVGPFASGKGTCAQRIKPWMKKMDEISQQASIVEDEYREKCRTRKANERAPKDPHVFKPKVPFTITKAQLLERMQNAKGHTLFSFSEELATVVSTNSRGQWANLRTTYCKAFDGSKDGQDCHSLDSVSGEARMRYNWSATGTYKAMDNFFKGDGLESGLASRVLFSEMPDNTFKKLVKHRQLSDTNIAHIDEAVEKLCNAKGTLNLKRITKALNKWVDEKRIVTLAAADRAAAAFRFRAPIIAFRSAVVVYLLAGEESRKVVKFALQMAEYVYREHLHLFANAFDDTTTKANMEQQRYSANGSIFDKLDKTFTSDDLRKLKPKAKAHAITQMVSSWKKEGWVKKVGNGEWEKTTDYATLLSRTGGTQGVMSSLSR